MRLKVCNFKCYADDDKEFEFNDNATTLIHGRSGVGKSTILDAINYALTGAGTKISTSGKRGHTTVELEFNGIKIIRTTKNHVIVYLKNGKKLENKEAEAKLSSMFGDSSLYYLHQDAKNAFILLSPADKKLFLEKLLLVDAIPNIETVGTDTVTKYKMALMVAEERVRSMELLITKVEKPCRTIEEINKDYETRRLLNKENTEKFNIVLNQLQDIQKQEAILKETETRLSSTSKQKTELEQKLTELGSRDVVLKEMSVCKTLLEQIKLNKKIRHLRHKIKKDQKSLNDEIAKQRDLINASLKSMSDLESKIEETKKLRDNVILYQQLVREDIDTYECPDCNANLKFENGVLVKTADKCTDSRIHHLEAIRGIDTPISVLDSAIVKLECQVVERDKLRRSLDSDDILPELVHRVNSVIKDYRDEIDILVSKVTMDTDGVDEDVVAKQLDNCNNKNIEIIKFQDRYKYLESEERDLVEKLEKMSKKSVTPNEILLKTQLDELVKKREEWQQYTFSTEKEFDHHNRYNAYMKSLDELDTKRRDLIEAEKMHNAAIIYKTKITEARNIVLENVIDLFNNHIKFYVDQFFDDPIIVTLSVSEKGQKLTTNINYHGHDYDLSSMSGGERDRILLASTLAFCEIVNSPLVMLDESLRSLDIDSANDIVNVLNGIKERTVLLISHQLVSGLFDYTLQC